MLDTCVIDGDLLSQLLPPLLVTEFVLGVLGNGLALWIFCFHLKPWKSSTVFLFNLALADFLLNVALPFRASYYFSGINWTFGDAFCNISLFSLAMNRGGSVFFLMAIAVDRYMRVVHPHHPINSMSLFKAVWCAAGLWVLTISLNVHLLTNSHHFRAGNSIKCESFTHKDRLHSTVFLLEFLLSLGIILFCTKRISSQLQVRGLVKEVRICRVQRCLRLVTVMFIICFLPSNFTWVLIWLRNNGDASIASKRDCDIQKALDTTFYITISLTYLNSMLDPIVYCFFSPSFKRICKQVLKLDARKSKKVMKQGGQQMYRPSISHSAVSVPVTNSKKQSSTEEQN
ncbi:hydroxycarboxylic acid receptor 3-like [Centroberyx gerrardi]|uniref:hydroxycarboxylic acid receptor 3-like n=1 Tax=Centroberyx gerrardi TaxID=166262 RepID=UPI003AB015D2